MITLVNKSGVRKFALDCASRRAHKFTRVSAEFYDDIEYRIRDLIRKKIEMLPSLGETIK